MTSEPSARCLPESNILRPFWAVFLHIFVCFTFQIKFSKHFHQWTNEKNQITNDSCWKFRPHISHGYNFIFWLGYAFEIDSKINSSFSQPTGDEITQSADSINQYMIVMIKSSYLHLQSFWLLWLRKISNLFFKKAFRFSTRHLIYISIYMNFVSIFRFVFSD